MGEAIQTAEIKGNLFSVSGKESLVARRLERLKNIRRIPFLFLFRILRLYIKKAFGISGSDRENADNYYFLTLINCDAHTVSISDSDYIFRTKSGIELKARKNPSSDLEVFNQVWGRDVYKKATQLLDDKRLDQLVIIDAGANVGYTALFFFQSFPNAKIIAVEPDDANFQILKKNIELNRADRILPIKAGIWNRRCDLVIENSFRDNREWSFQVKESISETELHGMHILDVMQDFYISEIDLLKIDIEGAEKYLFEDNSKAAEFLSKTKILALEIHDEEVSRQYIYEILRQNNFDFFEYSDLTIAQRQ